MSEPWMENPFDMSSVEPEDTVWGVPDHSVGQSRLDAGPPLTVKERVKRLVDPSKRPAQLRKPRNVKPVKKEIPNKPGQFIEPLTDLYNLVGVVAMPFEPEFSMTMLGPCRTPKEDEDAASVPSVAENCARALDEAAQRSESLRRALTGLTTASVWGAVAAAHAPLAMALLRRHGPWSSKEDVMGPAEAMEAMLKQRAEQGE